MVAMGFLYPSRPVNLLGPSPFRLIYCVILGSWGADVLQMVADQSLYYRSGYSLLDAIDFFGKRSYIYMYMYLLQEHTQYPTHTSACTFIL